MDNILPVVSDGLCVGCGSCAGICPVEAIEMRVSAGLILPAIEEDVCTRCGLCVECCPGQSVDFKDLNSFVFEQKQKDRLIGNYRTCYIGHSSNSDIRRSSSSGGIVTQLLVFALKKGLIDGALVTGAKKNSPLEPEPYIARNEREVISASKSKYCPAATNEALKLILKENGKYAVVGLPCQIHGIRKAERRIKALGERIVLHLGLMCSHTVNFFGTEMLLKKMGVSSSEVTRIDYRGSGWPGSLTVELTNGSNFSIPYAREWGAYWPVFSCFFFTPERCLMCLDETNELADISLGDAWLPQLKNERNGESIVVERTEAGARTLRLASLEGAISLKVVNRDVVVHSQLHPLKCKKADLSGRLAMILAFGLKIPTYKSDCRFSSFFFSYARNLFAFLNMRISKSEPLKNLLVYVPFPVFRLYYGIYLFLMRF